MTINVTFAEHVSDRMAENITAEICEAFGAEAATFADGRQVTLTLSRQGRRAALCGFLEELSQRGDLSCVQNAQGGGPTGA